MKIAILAQFDNFFYSAIKYSKVKLLLIDVKNNGFGSHYSDLYKITKTSSSEMPRSEDPNCRLSLKFDPTLPTAQIDENNTIVKPDEAFIYKKLKFSGPEFLLRIIYKAFRTLMLVFWFYFFPFCAILGSYILPYFIQKNADSVSLIKSPLS